jgi:sulfate adenylyltransferase
MSLIRSLFVPPSRRVAVAALRFSTRPGGKTASAPSTLLVPEHERNDLKVHATTLPDIVLKPRNSCDIELLLNGGFNPLSGFLNKQDTESVYDNYRLSDGTLWPMPINLDISTKKRLEIEEKQASEVALRDFEGNLIAVLNVEDIWEADKEREADQVFGGDPEHPAVDYLLNITRNREHYIGGSLKGYQLPVHYDYTKLRQSPLELRMMFDELGWDQIVAFQTRNPMHNAHIELVRRACTLHGTNALIHPVVGMTKPGDIDYHTRLKCIRAVVKEGAFGKTPTMMSLLPLAMRMAGPREALWHMLIRKNYGATHFILGRDHAGPGSNSSGVDFYGPYDARDFGVKHAAEVGIKTVEFEMMVYLEGDKKYVTADDVPDGQVPLKISGTEVRRRLQTGEAIPAWFSHPEVVKILRSSSPESANQGITLFFTGLSGSGKSTIANALLERLLEANTDRKVSVLDGDHVRHHLSSELGFSKEHRDLNIRRIGYVASEITKHGGIAICAAIAPYKDSRLQARNLVEQEGKFIEVFVDTTLEECENRDRKGLYAKARAGQLKGMTGVDDPYEAPENAEIVVQTLNTVTESVRMITDYLVEQGFIPPVEDSV